ncbi:MAG: L-threonylcarbamoyladenylate synthase [Flavobacteriales bacterium]
MNTIVSKNISTAASILQQEELVAIPTETVYGLAGNAFSEKAVKSIFETKQRPHFNPLILHFAEKEMLKDFAVNVPDEVQELMKIFWPGSLTLVLPKSKKISDLVSGNLNTVAMRIPNHELTLSLLKAIDFPLAAPSANMFGQLSPTSVEHVQNQLNGKIPMILDGGTCENGLESTIIGFENGTPKVYRLGAITLEEISKVLPSIIYNESSNDKIVAPGMLPYHYSPKAKLFLVNDLPSAISSFKNKNIGVVTFSTTVPNIEENKLKVLSKNRNFKEASHRLYASLHELDALNVEFIFVEKFPEYDLGRTINNRLLRASKKAD